MRCSGKPHEDTKQWRTFPHQHTNVGHVVPVTNFTSEETLLIWTAGSSADVTSTLLVLAGWTSAFADVRARKHLFHRSHNTAVCWTGRFLCSAEHMSSLLWLNNIPIYSPDFHFGWIKLIFFNTPFSLMCSVTFVSFSPKDNWISKAQYHYQH